MSMVDAIRQALRDELEAINNYDSYISVSTDPIVISTLQEIRDEEKVHVGELLTLLDMVDTSASDLHSEGAQEVSELISNARRLLGQKEGS